MAPYYRWSVRRRQAGEEFPDRNGLRPVDAFATRPEMHDEAALGPLNPLGERTEAFRVARTDRPATLDFDRPHVPAPLKDEVHLHATPRAEVEQPGVRPDPAAAALQLETDQVLQEQSALVVEWTVERAPEQGIANTHVEEQQFGMSNQARAVRSRPGRNPVNEQGVLEHVQVPAGRLVADRRVTRHRVYIDESPRSRRNEIEQARIPADVPHQRLGLNLLTKVGICIASEIPGTQLTIGFRVDARQGAVGERAVDVKVIPQFTRQQRVQVLDQPTAREKVGMPPAQLPGAGARQQEAEPAGMTVHERLNGVE
jgi:hypothetical protein